MLVLTKAICLNNNSKENELTAIIIQTINKREPQSVKQLVQMLKNTVNLRQEELLELILKLQAGGVIKLKNKSGPSDYSLAGSLWYLLTISAGAITVALVYSIGDNMYPWIYARNFFGVLFVFFLPGYAFTRALFTNKYNETLTNLEKIEFFALSVGLSIALVSIIGLALYYSPFQFDLSSVVVGLFVFTSVFATAGLLREKQT